MVSVLGVTFTSYDVCLSVSVFFTSLFFFRLGSLKKITNPSTQQTALRLIKCLAPGSSLLSPRKFVGKLFCTMDNFFAYFSSAHVPSLQFHFVCTLLEYTESWREKEFSLSKLNDICLLCIVWNASPGLIFFFQTVASHHPRCHHFGSTDKSRDENIWCKSSQLWGYIRVSLFALLFGASEPSSDSLCTHGDVSRRFFL